jgi:hypothetical protein
MLNQKMSIMKKPVNTPEGKKIEFNLIRRISWSFHYTTGKDYEELFSEASAAYCEALNDFDDSKGVKFTTYATTRMKNALSTYIKKMQVCLYEELPEPAYKQTAFFELYDQFSTDAKEVIDRVLRYPHDYLEQPPKMARGQLVRELRQEGYTQTRAWNILREIKEIVCRKNFI